MTDPLFVTVKDIQALTGKSDRTVRRWLQRRGISFHEQRSVSLAELRTKWKDFYDSLMLARSPVPPCPDCGAPTQCSCTVCDFVLT